VKIPLLGNGLSLSMSFCWTATDIENYDRKLVQRPTDRQPKFLMRGRLYARLFTRVDGSDSAAQYILMYIDSILMMTFQREMEM
jgi:hypothetical protein